MSKATVSRFLLAAACCFYMACLLAPIERQWGAGGLILLATLVGGISDIWSGDLSLWNVNRFRATTVIFLLPYYNVFVIYALARMWRRHYVPSLALSTFLAAGAVGFTANAAWIFLLSSGGPARKGLAAMYALGCLAAGLAAAAAFVRRAAVPASRRTQPAA